MNCRTDCPAVLGYEQVKETLSTELIKIDGLDSQVEASTQMNRATRRRMARVNKQAPFAHEAMRGISDADFYNSEAYAANAAARVALDEAISAQDAVIDVLLETCETQCPQQDNTSETPVLICGSPVALELYQ